MNRVVSIYVRYKDPQCELLLDYVQRHVSGDCGIVDDHDRRENETAIIVHMRIMSVYSLKNGVRIWIITEADRSSTCVMLPEEY